MARIKIALPERFSFSCKIAVRITDLNYGGHVGNDTFLSLVHEARVQFFKQLGYTELQFAGAGLIMSDAAIEFKNELFYGDIVTVYVGVADMSAVGFDLIYKLEVEAKSMVAGIAKTGMIVYDYEKKKVVPMSAEAKSALRG